MKIQNINSINFGLKKITHKKAYRKQTPVFNQSKTPQRTNIFEPYYVGKDYDFDRFDGRKIITISPDGNTILSKETGFNSTALELVEYKGKQTQTTRFKVNKNQSEKSECSYKITEDGKSKISAMSWNFPDKNFEYKGAIKDIPKLRKSLQHLRNTIHEKEYTDEFGFIQEINFQFKAVIGHLQEATDNQIK